MNERKKVLVDAGLSERTASALASIYSLAQCLDCAALVRRLKAEEDERRRAENG